MGHLSIGVSTTLCKYVLLPHLSLFTRENPHIQISISCQSTYQTMEALEKGTVDIGLIGENDRMDKFHFHPVQEIRDVFVCTQRYLDNLCKRVSFSGSPSSRDIISHSTLMLLDKENITRQYMEKYLVKEEITAAQTIEITSMDLLIDFAKIDLGIACVIEDFVQEELDTGNSSAFRCRYPSLPGRWLRLPEKSDLLRHRRKVFRFLYEACIKPASFNL